MRRVSILGDSISTYEGYNPTGYKVYYDEDRQRKNGLTSVYDTWWAKVNQALSAHICVNNSFSGSKVSGASFPAARSLERLQHLRTSYRIPDIILIYIGFNDFGYGVQTFKDPADHRFNPFIFEDAYNNMLMHIKQLYPSTTVVCGTLMRTRLANNPRLVFPKQNRGMYFEDYNWIIRHACEKTGCYLADIGSLDIRYETLDGTHPNKVGHQELAEAWLHYLSQMDL